MRSQREARGWWDGRGGAAVLVAVAAVMAVPAAAQTPDCLQVAALDQSTFEDVPETHWAYGAIAATAGSGMMRACGFRLTRRRRGRQ